MSAMRKLYLFLSLSFYLLSFIGNATAQEETLLDACKTYGLTLSKADQKKVDKADQMMVDSKSLLEKGMSNADEPQAKAILAQSREKFQTAAALMRQVYESNLLEFYKKASRIYINRFDHARYYDQKVDAYTTAAARNIMTSNYVTKQEEYNKLYANAYDNNKLAMINQLRSMKIYQDFPIEYPYDWDDFFKERQIMLAREQANRKVNADSLKQEAKESFRMIFFKVQIAAHTIEIPESQLKTLYRGNMPIVMTQENGWYKYTIGNYERYDQALELLKACQVRKAFIVAYDERNIRQDLKEILNE